MRTKKNVFWGILCLLAAAALIVDRLGVFGEAFSFWELIASAFLAALAVNGLWKRDWGTALFSLAFLAIVNDELLQIEQLTPWPVLGAACLGSIGLYMLFPAKGRTEKAVSIESDVPGDLEVKEEYVEETGEDDETVVNFEVTFASAVRYLQCDDFSGANFEAWFGKMEIYFENVWIPEGKAVSINAEAAFGSMELYIPKTWNVTCIHEAAFGGVKEYGVPDADGKNEVTINAEANFGFINIHYV